MKLNPWGHIVEKYGQDLPRHFPNIELGPFMVMPNHAHFIIGLNPPVVVEAQSVGAQFNCAPTMTTTTTRDAIGKRFTVNKQRPTLGQVVRAFKAATARLIRRAGGDGFVWQRSYFEHIIRNEDELSRISQYILANPANWLTDEENPVTTKR